MHAAAREGNADQRAERRAHALGPFDVHRGGIKASQPLEKRGTGQDIVLLRETGRRKLREKLSERKQFVVMDICQRDINPA
jgi:hypothetical protein